VSDLAARSLAVAAKAAIGDLGGAWMSTDAEEQATADAGMKDWQLYFLGRHGVLGDVDPDVIVAAAGVFPADHLRGEWEIARSLMTPEEATRRYVAVCHLWGRENLAGVPDIERLADLGQQLVDGADVVGLPLFAGWRALPVPSDPAERCAHVMQLLREHRGACHTVALTALRMPPLVAILTNTGGVDNAVEYGWQPPFPAVTDNDRALRERVEDLTDDVVAQAYGVLDTSEGGEFLDLLEGAHSAVFGPR
jgi:hypothetical protein